MAGNSSVHASLQQVHSWVHCGVPSAIAEIIPDYNTRFTEWLERYHNSGDVLAIFISIQQQPQDQEEDMALVWCTALWSAMRGPQLPELKHAPEKRKPNTLGRAGSYHGCHLSLGQTLYCHNFQNTTIIVLLVVCNTWCGLCHILSKMPMQHNSLW